MVARIELLSCSIVPDMLFPAVLLGGTIESISDETASESPGFSPGSSVVLSSCPPPISGVSSILIAAIATSPIVLVSTVTPLSMSPAVRFPLWILDIILLLLSR